MNVKEHKELFQKYFKELIKEQSLIRNDMLGHSISSIYYTPKLDAWNIDIKDENIIHLPMGVVTLVLSNGKHYQINTNYQSWSGRSFGVLLKKLEKEEFTKNKLELDKDYYNKEHIWSPFQDVLITKVNWNWKTKLEEPKNGKKLSLSLASKYIFEDYFVPESLILEFENKEKVFFFGLEPDEKKTYNNTYSLIRGGEELIIFLNENKLERWNLKNIGFQIIDNN